MTPPIRWFIPHGCGKGDAADPHDCSLVQNGKRVGGVMTPPYAHDLLKGIEPSGTQECNEYCPAEHA